MKKRDQQAQGSSRSSSHKSEAGPKRSRHPANTGRQDIEFSAMGLFKGRSDKAEGPDGEKPPFTKVNDVI